MSDAAPNDRENSTLMRLLSWMLVAGLSVSGVAVGVAAVVYDRWLHVGLGACIIGFAFLMMQVLLLGPGPELERENVSQ